MYDDVGRKNIALCHDYMSDACSGEGRLWLLVFVNNSKLNLYTIYLLLLLFVEWHRLTRFLSWRSAFHNFARNFDQLTADLDFLTMGKRLHRNHANEAKFKQAWSVIGWVTAPRYNLCSQHSNFIFYRREGKATVQMLNRILPCLTVYTFVSSVQQPKIGTA